MCIQNWTNLIKLFRKNHIPNVNHTSQLQTTNHCAEELTNNGTDIKQLNCKAQMVALDPKRNHKTNISKDKRIITNKLSGQQEDIKIQSNYKDGYWYLITRKSDKKTTFQMKIRGKKWRLDGDQMTGVGWGWDDSNLAITDKIHFKKSFFDSLTSYLEIYFREIRREVL